MTFDPSHPDPWVNLLAAVIRLWAVILERWPRLPRGK
jgi:hypothetical protein